MTEHEGHFTRFLRRFSKLAHANLCFILLLVKFINLRFMINNIFFNKHAIFFHKTRNIKKKKSQRQNCYECKQARKSSLTLSFCIVGLDTIQLDSIQHLFNFTPQSSSSEQAYDSTQTQILIVWSQT